MLVLSSRSTHFQNTNEFLLFVALEIMGFLLNILSFLEEMVWLLQDICLISDIVLLYIILRKALVRCS